MYRLLSLALALAIMLGCGIALAQESTPPAGTGSAQQPIPPAGQPSQSPTPAPTTAQPAPAPAPAPGQAATPAAGTNSPGAKQVRIAPGSVIAVRLDKTVDAKKAKQGDEVIAKVPQDLQSNSGQVVLPKDSKVVGHVTQVQARTKDQKESQLAITFDRVDIKNGEQMQVPMSIQAIIAPPNNNANADNNGAAANDASTPAPSGTAGSQSAGSMGGRGGMAGNSSAPSGSDNSNNAPSQSASTSSRPQITGDTRGVVGIPNLNLSSESNPSQGSVVTSEKNNVKLQDGTFLLLRVNSEGASGQPAPSPSAPTPPQQ